MSITNSGKTVKFSGEEIYEYFNPNPCIVFNRDSSSFSMRVVDGGYDPYFISVENVLKSGMQEGEQLENGLNILERLIPVLFISLLVVLVISIAVYYNNSIGAISFSAVFLLIIILPFLKLALGNDGKNANLEKRELAKMPAFALDSIEKYPAEFELFFNDNFGLRDFLVGWGSKVKSRYFKSSIAPDWVVHGKDNWLFLSGSFDNILDDYSRRNLYSPEVLAWLLDMWENQARLLESRNIRYYKTFYPNKHTIYPEKLPYFIQIQKLDTISRPDQILTYIHDSTLSLKFIDLRGVLLKGKEQAQLYRKHDTHWNEYGVFLAYQELMKSISRDFPELKAKEAKDFKIVWEPVSGGDLTSLLGTQDIEDYTDTKPVFTSLAPERVEEAKEENGEIKKSIS